MIQATGEDGIDDLHRNRHDVNEVGRLGAQSLLVNDAVHLKYGLGVSDGLTDAWHTSSALLLPNHRHFTHETGIFWLGFSGPDCYLTAEQGGGPDAKPSRAGSGSRAEVAAQLQLEFRRRNCQSIEVRAGIQLEVLSPTFQTIMGVRQECFLSRTLVDLFLENIVQLALEHIVIIAKINVTVPTTSVS